MTIFIFRKNDYFCFNWKGSDNNRIFSSGAPMNRFYIGVIVPFFIAINGL